MPRGRKAGVPRLLRRAETGVASSRIVHELKGMDIEEAEDLTECWDCGTPVSTADAIYAFGEQGLLCHRCALRRGGTYDAKQERWVGAPDVADLPDERRSEQLKG